jgi:hypothetical protein
MLTNRAGQHMVDELLLQLLKQLTGNKRQASRLRGWKILALTLHLFQPSPELDPFLLAALQQLEAVAADGQGVGRRSIAMGVGAGMGVHGIANQLMAGVGVSATKGGDTSEKQRLPRGSLAQVVTCCPLDELTAVSYCLHTALSHSPTLHTALDKISLTLAQNTQHDANEEMVGCLTSGGIRLNRQRTHEDGNNMPNTATIHAAMQVTYSLTHSHSLSHAHSHTLSHAR